MILTLWLPGLAATRWYRAATPQKRTPNPSSVVLLEDHVSFKISDEVMIWCYGLWSKTDLWSSTSGWPNMIWFLSYSSVIFPGLSAWHPTSFFPVDPWQMVAFPKWPGQPVVARYLGHLATGQPLWFFLPPALDVSINLDPKATFFVKVKEWKDYEAPAM